MTFKQALKLSTYLLLLVGAAAVVASGAIGLIVAVAYLIGLAYSWLAKPKRVSELFQTGFVLLLLLGYGVDLLLLGHLVPATVGLLLLLSLFKLLTRSGVRDYLLLHLISFSLLLVASTFTISVVFLLALVGFLFFSILAFMLLEGKSAYDENPLADFSLTGHISSALLMTAMIALLAIPIFLAIPRGSLGLIRGSQARVSGFSDSVRLGDMGPILKSSRVVMRVRLDRPPEQVPVDIKWRGIALDHYDGRGWSNTRGISQNFQADEKGRFVVARERRQEENQLVQRFSLEPFGNMLFGASRIIQISQMSGVLFPRIKILRDGNGSLFLFPNTDEFQYVVHSDYQSRDQKIA